MLRFTLVDLTRLDLAFRFEPLSTAGIPA